MDESICLDDDNLLSPLEERPTLSSQLSKLEGLSIGENSGQMIEDGAASDLDNVSLDLKIDLGSQISLDKVADDAQTANAGQALVPDPAANEVADKDEEGKVSTDVTPNVENDISSYFSKDTSDDPFASVPSNTHTSIDDEDQNTDNLSEKDGEKEDSTPTEEAASETGETICRLRTESASSSGAFQEAVPVGFEESKGSGGLKYVGSTECVQRFFSEDNDTTDEDATSFFESFTAGDGEGLEESQAKQPLSLEIGAQPLTSIPETPPIPGQSSPVPSPLHQSGTRSRTTSQSSTGVSPYPSVTRQFSDGLGSLDSNANSGGENNSSETSAFQGDTDIFSSSLNISDADRRKDAWIPTEHTRDALVSMVTSLPGTYFPEQSQLTMPTILSTDAMADPVKELLMRFMGEGEASKYFTLTANNVPHDDNGIRQLIKKECYRSAIDLTGIILSSMNQGPGSTSIASKNTPYSLQVWFTRIALLVKLRLYAQAESEIQAFGGLDKPDMYYEYYPDLYHGRRGSLVPFSFRLLHADLPQYLGKSQESLDRLYYVKAIVDKILSNLESGLGEDGSMITIADDSRQASQQLWEQRQIRTLYSICNCLLHAKDYNTAVSILGTLVKLDKSNIGAVYGGIGRIYMQMGDVKMAETYFNKADALNKNNSTVNSLMNKGFIALGTNQFKDAQEYFYQAVQAEPTNAVAVNNMAVCFLYQGKLKEALATLEQLVFDDPVHYLQEGILFNLCTLYELESSRAVNKKQALLDLVSKYKGNGFNVACLKMT